MSSISPSRKGLSAQYCRRGIVFLLYEAIAAIEQRFPAPIEPGSAEELALHQAFGLIFAVPFEIYARIYSDRRTNDRHNVCHRFGVAKASVESSLRSTVAAISSTITVGTSDQLVAALLTFKAPPVAPKFNFRCAIFRRRLTLNLQVFFKPSFCQ
jgi:hypothetical protein